MTTDCGTGVATVNTGKASERGCLQNSGSLTSLDLMYQD